MIRCRFESAFVEKLRIRIRKNDADPSDSGSATLVVDAFLYSTSAHITAYPHILPCSQNLGTPAAGQPLEPGGPSFVGHPFPYAGGGNQTLPLPNQPLFDPNQPG